ncbi:MAG: hypothetical protein MUE41_12410 [Gemmatimonadaceae bacterium]|nr:hypothetical protein [Gemmatimonadaceae bacterium]
MRTTIDLDETLLERLRDAAQRERTPFRSFLNRLLFEALEARARRPAGSVTSPKAERMGPPRAGLDLDKANALAAALEDEELLRKLRERR